MPNKKKEYIRNDLVNSLTSQVVGGMSIEGLHEIMVQTKLNRWEARKILLCLSSYSFIKERLEEIKGTLDFYLINTTPDSEKIKCVVCTASLPIETNFIFILDGDFESAEETPVCDNCYKNKNSILNYCLMHGAFFSKDIEVVCGLYDKCKEVHSCPRKKCLEKHYRTFHKGYQKRKWKPVKKFLGGREGEIITSNIPTGVEFEVVGLSDNTTRKHFFKLDKNIGISTDESIRNHFDPTEIQTPPSSLKKLETVVKQICEASKAGGYGVNTRCGIHIHLGLDEQYKTVHQNPMLYRSLLLAYAVFEPVFMKLVPRSRKNNRYANSIAIYRDSFLQWGDGYGKAKVSRLWYMGTNSLEGISARIKDKRDTTKYLWVTFHSVFRKEGLEIRLMEGSLDSNSILNWINLHHKFIQGIAEAPEAFYERKDIINLIKLALNKSPALEDRFMAIIERGCDSTKEMEILTRFIKERKELHKRSLAVDIDARPILPSMSVVSIDRESGLERVFNGTNPTINIEVDETRLPRNWRNLMPDSPLN